MRKPRLREVESLDQDHMAKHGSWTGDFIFLTLYLVLFLLESQRAVAEACRAGSCPCRQPPALPAFSPSAASSWLTCRRFCNSPFLFRSVLHSHTLFAPSPGSDSLTRAVVHCYWGTVVWDVTGRLSLVRNLVLFQSHPSFSHYRALKRFHTLMWFAT